MNDCVYVYVGFEDRFEVTCKNCGSKKVDLSVEKCETCGDSISGFCNDCKAEFKYHDFKPAEK